MTKVCKTNKTQDMFYVTKLIKPKTSITGKNWKTKPKYYKI